MQNPIQRPRVVITGIGLTAPNGNTLSEFRQALLDGKSGIQEYNIRYFGKTLAGICNFDPYKYQKKKDVRRGTRAGSIGVYCAHEAIQDSALDWENVDKSRIGVYVGITEHGNVETENEVYKKMEPEWVDIPKAIEIFGTYKSLTPDKASLYLREFTILNKLI